MKIFRTDVFSDSKFIVGSTVSLTKLNKKKARKLSFYLLGEHFNLIKMSVNDSQIGKMFASIRQKNAQKLNETVSDCKSKFL